MAIVVLSRIDREQFGPLTESLIEDNLRTIYDNFGRLQALSPTAHHPSIAVLQSMLREHNQELLNEIFDLLKAIHDPEAVEIVAESLDSDTARVRANAVEALESLTTPRTAGLIAPLFDTSLDPKELVRIGQTTWEKEIPGTAEVIRQLITAADDPWLRAVMSFAIGELGAEMAAKERHVPPTAPSKPASPLDRIAGALAEEEKPPPRRPSPADLLAKLTDDEQEPEVPPSEETVPTASPGIADRPVFTLAEIESMLEVSLTDPVVDVRIAANTAKRMIAGLQVTSATQKEEAVLSTIERVIFLKEVSFFQRMTVDQLKVLATICEEEFFEGEQEIFDEGDPGGALYVVVSGRVAIERSTQRKGSVVRLATIEPRSYFGEMSLFDEFPRSTAARAIQDTLTLRLRREPVVVLSRQYPDLSLELINVLSQRLREANDRIADLTRARPRELDKLYDKLDG
jgi:CRP-like cAMP-binding protein